MWRTTLGSVCVVDIRTRSRRAPTRSCDRPQFPLHDSHHLCAHVDLRPHVPAPQVLAQDATGGPSVHMHLRSPAVSERLPAAAAAQLAPLPLGLTTGLAHTIQFERTTAQALVGRWCWPRSSCWRWHRQRWRSLIRCGRGRPGYAAAGVLVSSTKRGPFQNVSDVYSRAEKVAFAQGAIDVFTKVVYPAGTMARAVNNKNGT
jgi:hypothetical protein